VAVGRGVEVLAETAVGVAGADGVSLLQATISEMRQQRTAGTE
jgi:hypothetical protein